jgi:hypothetical protein
MAPMPKVEIPFDTYLDYAAMTAHLQALAAAHPTFAKLTSVAKSFQGRDVWLMEITNPATGPAHEKPGYYIDAQIHAEEHGAICDLALAGELRHRSAGDAAGG